MHAVMYLLLVYTFIILTYELYVYDHDVAASGMLKFGI